MSVRIMALMQNEPGLTETANSYGILLVFLVIVVLAIAGFLFLRGRRRR